MPSKNLFNFLHQNNLHHLLQPKAQLIQQQSHYPVMHRNITNLVLSRLHSLCKLQLHLYTPERPLSVLDCTFGTGGHYQCLSSKSDLLHMYRFEFFISRAGIDIDENMISKGKAKFKDVPLFIDKFSNFMNYKPKDIFK